MSNPTVSFRISNDHLARGLRAIRLYEPDWKLTTTSNLIRTIFNDYIAKSEQLNYISKNVTPKLLQEIIQSRANENKKSEAELDNEPLPQLGTIS